MVRITQSVVFKLSASRHATVKSIWQMPRAFEHQARERKR
jgi:hypothetical protein